MGAVIAVIVTFLLGTLIGYIVHWMLHQRWSGPLYKVHMNHHVVQYPPKNLMSAGYRSSGRTSVWAFVPPLTVFVAITLGVLWIAGAQWWLHAIIIVESALIGWLHDYAHDGLHVTGHPLEKVPGFGWLRRQHSVHHRNMKRNLGIMWFGWDRILGTYREP